jgi:hypothetical protein
MKDKSFENDIYETMLKRAVRDVDNAEAEQSSATDDLTETLRFSPGFEKRMMKYAPKNKRKYSRQSTRRKMVTAASVVIVIGIVVADTMSVQAVRTAVATMFSTWFDGGTQYTFTDPNEPTPPPPPEPTPELSPDTPSVPTLYIPAGFVETERFHLFDLETIIYQNEDGVELSLTTAPHGHAFVIDNENTEFSMVDTDDITFHVYTATMPEFVSFVIWQTDGSSYRLESAYDVQELIKMAKSIT